MEDAPDPEVAWERLLNEMGKGQAGYVGMEGARARYLSGHPGGFASHKHKELERDYKVRASEMLQELAPLPAALEAQGLGADVLRVYQATQLLSLHEKVRVAELLKGPRADEFVRAAARFTEDPSPSTLSALAVVLRADDCAKWTVVTYLPFLWAPDRHMFLKPTKTKDFAERIGHPLFHVYCASLDFAVYESLLDLATTTRAALTDIGAVDNIDVQSFIWVVGGYTDEELAAPG